MNEIQGFLARTAALRAKLAADEAKSAKQVKYHYCKGGAGYLLYQGRQIIWETVTISAMLEYFKEKGIGRNVEYRRTIIAVIR